LAIRKNEAISPEIGFESLKVDRAEPLQVELASFFDSVRTGNKPRVDAVQAAAALAVAEAILAKIKEHTDLVAETIRRHR
jgi:predicted dehydrogenase